MSNFCFVVLHYNAFDATMDCIHSIMNLRDTASIVLIDNASTNDSFARLKDEIKRLSLEYDGEIALIHNDKNEGFSRANNKALSFAKEHFSFKFIVFTNNDVVFEDVDFIKKAKAEYERSHFGVLGPDVYNPIQRIHQSPISFSQGIPLKRVKKTILLNDIALKLYPLYYSLMIKDKKEPIVSVEKENIKYMTGITPLGSCLVISEDVFNRKEGVFYPETFFYYEEYILASYCKKMGIPIVFNPDIRVLHNHSVATKSLGNKRTVERFKMTNIRDAAKIYADYIAKIYGK